MDLDDQDLQNNFPFLTGLIYRQIEYIGIIQNSDDKIVSFYDFNNIKTPEDQKLFIELGQEWWWESNRKLPINIFLGDEMGIFRYCLRTIISKDVKILFGPVTSLNDMVTKRIKRRQIQLIRRCR